MTIAAALPRVGLVRALLVVTATVAAAAFSFSFTMDQVLGTRLPAVASSYWAGSRSQSVLAGRSLLRAKGPADMARVAAEARYALSREPVSGSAAGTLALALDASGKEAEARRFFDYAERQTRRDPRIQLWAIEDRVAHNDIAGALIHYDRALRVSPESGEMLYPVLSRAAEDPAIAAPLATLLSKRPRWWSSFILRLVPASTSPDSLYLIMASIKPRRTDLGERQLLSFAMNRLIQLGAPEKAFALYRQAGSANVNRAGVRNGTFNEPNDLPPFDWSIADSASIEARSDSVRDMDGQMALRIGESGGDPVRARQLMILPPGAWRLTLLAGDVVGEPEQRPFVQVECTTGAADRALAKFVPGESSSQGVSFAFDLVVPEHGCSAQWLTLRAGPPMEPAPPISSWFDDVEIHSRSKS